MFSFFKRENLTKALDSCQQQLKLQGIKTELTDSQYQIILNTSLFRDIDSRFKSKGLSQWGGLAWYCAQMIGKTLETLKSGKEMSSNITDLSEKIAIISLLLGNSIPGLKLTQNDIGAISSASEIALKWLEATESSVDREIATLLGK